MWQTVSLWTFLSRCFLSGYENGGLSKCKSHGSAGWAFLWDPGAPDSQALKDVPHLSHRSVWRCSVHLQDAISQSRDVKPVLPARRVSQKTTVCGDVISHAIVEGWISVWNLYEGLLWCFGLMYRLRDAGRRLSVSLFKGLTVFLSD